jgi:hypothetical protein
MITPHEVCGCHVQIAAMDLGEHFSAKPCVSVTTHVDAHKSMVLPMS